MVYLALVNVLYGEIKKKGMALMLCIKLRQCEILIQKLYKDNNCFIEIIISLKFSLTSNWKNILNFPLNYKKTKICLFLNKIDFVDQKRLSTIRSI
ncbi:hypothetical protein BpHYR1_031222 [Brachionus plicatilis]|uniref:Uncharacterized protein n=1 Tax=Brachionus plicatilis TaxID=10195 RepID=A0A3M7PTS6_BRAPC|nr:hypothetical protein BpHYR1_031222 [Brachionus plicatilis]